MARKLHYHGHMKYVHSVFAYKQYKTWQMEGYLLLQHVKKCQWVKKYSKHCTRSDQLTASCCLFHLCYTFDWPTVQLAVK